MMKGVATATRGVPIIVDPKKTGMPIHRRPFAMVADIALIVGPNAFRV